MKNFCGKLCCLSSSASSVKLCGMPTNRSVKFIYIVIIISLYGITVVMNKIKTEETRLEEFDCQGKQHQMQCVNEQIQFRNMASLSITFLVLGICMFFKPDIAKIVNEGIWIIKLIILAIIMVTLQLLIPQNVINFFEIVSSFLTFFYYLIQNLVLIDCAFKLDNYLTQLIAESNNAKRYLLLKLITTAYLCLCSIFMNVLSYLQLPLYISITNSVIMVISFFVVVFRIFPNNTLLVWGTITLLTNMLSFLCYPTQTVDEVSLNYIQIIFQIALALIFFIGMLASSSKRIRTKAYIINQLFALTTSEDEQDARYIASNKWRVYYLVMAISVMSLPAIVHIKYHSNLQQQSNIIEYSRIWAIASAYIIYFWSLIASKLYKTDDFSELENYFREFQLN